ncbi:MAG: CarD family transcriptional regulator [Clostridiales bacterium]|jgi:CarD family transcriptional regulator|nr:CarD family transcriptional regulator [Clostridiales bacterium]
MFNIGDLIIYSAQGVCHIDDICEKTYAGVTRNYYILHPMNNTKLKISTPVDNDKVAMLELIDRNEAVEIIESFKLPGIDWIELSGQRNQMYSEIVKKGNRLEISSIVNTLMRKKHKAEISRKTLNSRDNKLLTLVQNTLFTELAMSLNTTYEVINGKVNSLINEYEY